MIDVIVIVLFGCNGKTLYIQYAEFSASVTTTLFVFTGKENRTLRYDCLPGNIWEKAFPKRCGLAAGWARAGVACAMYWVLGGGALTGAALG